MDLLNKMLQFNPYFRITVEEALEHPFLERVRKQEKEIISKEAITIEFDQSQQTLDKKRLRQIFLEEVELFKKNKEGRFASE